MFEEVQGGAKDISMQEDRNKEDYKFFGNFDSLR